MTRCMGTAPSGSGVGYGHLTTKCWGLRAGNHYQVDESKHHGSPHMYFSAAPPAPRLAHGQRENYSTKNGHGTLKLPAQSWMMCSQPQDLCCALSGRETAHPATTDDLTSPCEGTQAKPLPYLSHPE